LLEKKKKAGKQLSLARQLLVLQCSAVQCVAMQCMHATRALRCSSFLGCYHDMMSLFSCTHHLIMVLLPTQPKQTSLFASGVTLTGQTTARA
jgi:hypothetical protein